MSEFNMSELIAKKAVEQARYAVFFAEKQLEEELADRRNTLEGIIARPLATHYTTFITTTSYLEGLGFNVLWETSRDAWEISIPSELEWSLKLEGMKNA